MKKDIFSSLKYDILDEVPFDIVDTIELDTEDKILYSDEFKSLLREELARKIDEIPFQNLIQESLAKQLDKKDFPGLINKTRESIETKIYQENFRAKFKLNEDLEKLSREIKEKHANIRNILNSEERYTFGGFAPPNPLTGASGTFLKNTNQTWNGLQWSSPTGISIGSAVTGGTSTDILFIGPTGLLAQSSNFTWDDTARKLTFSGQGYIHDDGVGHVLQIVAPAADGGIEITGGQTSGDVTLSAWNIDIESKDGLTLHDLDNIQLTADNTNITLSAPEVDIFARTNIYDPLLISTSAIVTGYVDAQTVISNPTGAGVFRFEGQSYAKFEFKAIKGGTVNTGAWQLYARNDGSNKPFLHLGTLNDAENSEGGIFSVYREGTQPYFFGESIFQSNQFFDGNFSTRGWDPSISDFNGSFAAPLMLGDYAVQDTGNYLAIDEANGKMWTNGLNLGVKQASPTAYLHLGAGTATANTGPLKFTTGTNLTAAEAGTMEYATPDLFFTPGSAIRYNLPLVTGAGTQGDLIYASGASIYSRLAKDTNSTRYLSNQGTSNNPSWNQINLANGVTGTLPVANGGTGSTVLFQDNVALTNQGADIATTNFTNGGTGTTFRVSYSLQDTTSDVSAGAVTLTIAYTDAAGAATTTANQVLTGVGRVSGSIYLQRASGNVTYAITHTGIFGSAKYALYLTLERLS